MIGYVAVLEFWFGRGLTDAEIIREKSDLWWNATAEIDAEVRQRFAELHDEVRNGAHQDWADTAEGRLALIIVLDQFQRHIYRDDPRAYGSAEGEHARRLCLDGISLGLDIALSHVRRAFFYLPLEHSEDPADQERSVQLNEALVTEVPESLREKFESYLHYAREHRDVITSFGRFPHRNAVLGRMNTGGEEVYLGLWSGA